MTGRGCPAGPPYGPQSAEHAQVRALGCPNWHRPSQGVAGVDWTMADGVAALLARIRARLDADERIALAASVNDDDATPTGEHWHWECTNCDTEVPITITMLDEYMRCPACGSYGLGLRSVEHYPTRWVGELPHFVVDTEELRPADGLHITRHHPARVLTTVAALCEVVEIIHDELGDSRAGHAALSALARVDGDDQ